MNTRIKTDRLANLIGSVWMVVAMVVFAVIALLRPYTLQLRLSLELLPTKV